MIFTIILLAHLQIVPTKPKDSWFGSDKAKHFLVSAFIQSASYATLRAAGAGNGPALAGASLITLSVGVGKEVDDRRVGKVFSPKDLTWDLLGAVAASTLLVRTRR